MHWLTLITLWAGFQVATSSGAAELTTNVFCLVCQSGPLRGQIWLHKRGHVCDACYKKEPKCSLCGLPALTETAKTSDGRIFCRWDVPEVVLTQDQARQIFDDTRTALLQQWGRIIELKQPDIAFSLYDVDYWNKQDGKREINPMHRTGFSHTRLIEGRWTHTVLLYSGRSRAETACVCAHELMHLWINENKPESHRLEPDTREGLCELLAYKLAENRGDTNQMVILRNNTYTHGRINDMIVGEARFGMRAILDWIVTGTEPQLPEKLAGSNQPQSPIQKVAMGIPDAPVYDRFKLQGIMGTNKRRLALINDKQFEPGTEIMLVVSGQLRKVKCLEVTETNVKLIVDETASPILLQKE
jgi:hypothetical protein